MTEHTHIGLFRYPSLGTGPRISDHQVKIHHGATWGEGASFLFWHELFWLCSVFADHFATNLSWLPSRSSGNGWRSGVVTSGTGVYRRPSRRPAGRTQLLSGGKLGPNQGTFLAWVTLRHVSLWQNQANHRRTQVNNQPSAVCGQNWISSCPFNTSKSYPLLWISLEL